MVEGKVLASGEATVRVRVRGITGQTAQVDALVDTGFNDEMTLPKWAIEKLGLKYVSACNYTLGDGLRSAARVFEGEIQWHGIWRELYVVELENDALVGMGMMAGCQVRIDVVEDGRVEIRPLVGV